MKMNETKNGGMIFTIILTMSNTFDFFMDVFIEVDFHDTVRNCHDNGIKCHEMPVKCN